MAENLEAYTANKIWFEFLDNGRYRIYINYTIPELKEYRRCYVDFTKKREAEEFYWKLVRGADFFPSDPKSLKFINKKKFPNPW